MAGPVEARLGPIERVHHARRTLRRARLATAMLLLAAAIVALSVAAYRAFVAYTEYGPLLVSRWVGLPLTVGVVLALVGVWFGVRAWRTSRLRARVHANGLAVVRGRRGRALTWADVRAVWSRAERTGLPGLSDGRRWRMELEAVDGRRLALDDSLEDFETLAESIRAHIYPLLMAQYTFAFNQKESLPFGRLHLGPTGIEEGARSYPWKDIRGAQLAGGRLTIETTGPDRPSAIVFPARQIPNVELCAQLIQEIGQRA